MDNSLIGKQFIYKDQNLIILDEAKIISIDKWKLYVQIITDIYLLSFEIINTVTYINYHSVGSLTEFKARELLFRIFDDLSKINCFKGYLNHNLFGENTYEINLIMES